MSLTKGTKKVINLSRRACERKYRKNAHKRLECLKRILRVWVKDSIVQFERKR